MWPTQEEGAGTLGRDPLLGCPYLGPENLKQVVGNTWKNESLGRQVNLMSHYCVNGSLSHLSQEQWDKLCFPSHQEAGNIEHKIAGVWGLFVIIVGTFGNLLTLIAILYAKRKRRYDFHLQFWTTHIWVLHLAIVDLIMCTIPLPVVFILPYLGLRPLQAPGMDHFLRAAFIIGHQTLYTDWLCLALIVLTRALHLKFPRRWKQVCENKIYVALLLLLPWVISAFYILPHAIQPSLDFGYHCLFGHTTHIPTGEAPLPFLVQSKWILDLLTGIVAFFLPLKIMITSYVVIWKHVKRVKSDQKRIASVQTESNRTLTHMEMKLIETFFVVCIFYVMFTLPIALAKMFKELRSHTSMLVLSSTMFTNFIINFILYAWRSKQYRSAYRDVLVRICPRLVKASKKMQRPLGTNSTALKLNLMSVKKSVEKREK